MLVVKFKQVLFHSLNRNIHILLFASLIENIFNFYIKEWSG